jgi:hypothetical protein
MAKRTKTNIAVLVQVMDELGFDQETIAKLTGVSLRTINDLANRRGYWRYKNNGESRKVSQHQQANGRSGNIAQHGLPIYGQWHAEYHGW